MPIIRLQNLLESSNNNGLEKLVRRALDMDRLTVALKSGLGSDLGPHLVAANLRGDGILVVVADSPSWASRLRYETAKLMEIARKSGSNVASCRVVVTTARDGSAAPDEGSSTPAFERKKPL